MRNQHPKSSTDLLHYDALSAPHLSGSQHLAGPRHAGQPSCDAVRIAPSSKCSRAVDEAHPVCYAFSQAFGENTAHGHPDFNIQDMITSVRFNRDSDMIATGDHGGRIVLLKRVDGRPRARNGRPRRTELDADDERPRQQRTASAWEPPQFEFWTQFQSHDPEFDYLKGIEIEEKIVEIAWCRPANGAQRLLASNEKAIKLWRVFEKEVKEVISIDPRGRETRRTLATTSSAVCSSNAPWGFGNRMSPSIQRRIEDAGARKSKRLSSFLKQRPLPPPGPVEQPAYPALRARFASSNNAAALRLPRVATRSRCIAADPRRVFSHPYGFFIHSVSMSSDEETFLSADDLRINVGNLHHGSGNGFNVVDVKPDKIHDLSEVITRAQFHPEHCHLFAYGNSRGVVRLCDLRESALCNGSASSFATRRATDDEKGAAFFSEIVGAISDVRFSPSGRHLLTRDFLRLRLWDVRMEHRPLLTVPVHEHLRRRLDALYQNEAVYDKFQCGFDASGGSILAGSYNSKFHAYSAATGAGAVVEASVDVVTAHAGLARPYATDLLSRRVPTSQLCDPRRKILRLDAASNEPFAAVAAGPSLYIYYAPPYRATGF